MSEKVKFFLDDGESVGADVLLVVPVFPAHEFCQDGDLLLEGLLLEGGHADVGRMGTRGMRRMMIPAF